MSKYRAVKTVINGIKFDSKAEANYYIYLKNEEFRGKLKIISLQPKVYLTDAKILYKPDFLIQANGEYIYIDVKGVTTPVFAIKKRLWKFYGPGALKIIKGKKTEIFNSLIIKK